MKPAVFLCSVVAAALGPHGSCDGSSANCTGCSCYPEARSCRAAGCSFEHGRCVATAGPQRCPVKMQGGNALCLQDRCGGHQRDLATLQPAAFAPLLLANVCRCRWVCWDNGGVCAPHLEPKRCGVSSALRLLHQLADRFPGGMQTCRAGDRTKLQVEGNSCAVCWSGTQVLSEKKLAKYLVGLMTAPDETALLKTFDSVTDFGSETIKSLCESTEKGWPGSVYDPSGAHSSLKELQHEQELGRPYWGVSGGGGCWSGLWDFMCGSRWWGAHHHRWWRWGWRHEQSSSPGRHWGRWRWWWRGVGGWGWPYRGGGGWHRWLWGRAGDGADGSFGFASGSSG